MLLSNMPLYLEKGRRTERTERPRDEVQIVKVRGGQRTGGSTGLQLSLCCAHSVTLALRNTWDIKTGKQ